MCELVEEMLPSPFSGEGHRKVWARLRALDGIRVGRDRVLRLMRENALLSPHRGPQRPVNDQTDASSSSSPPPRPVSCGARTRR